MAQLDSNPARNAFKYCVTLTTSGDFTAEQEVSIVDWFRRKCENCLLVSELHKDGSTHYHATVVVLSPSSTGMFTKVLKTLYKKIGLEVSPKSICVKKTCNLTGFFFYLLKELEPNVLLCLGWQMSWIKEQCISNVKNIPRKMLMANRVVLNPANAIPYCLKFAEAAGITVSGKIDFKILVRHMVKDGYSFDNTKLPWLYAQLMCICGDDRALDQQIDNQLAFLD